PPPAVPEREGEHAAQALEQRIALQLVERQDDFAVALRAETVAARLQLGAQLTVVVYLAVADEAERTVRADERLPAAFGIDDGQPPMAEPGAGTVPDAFSVRSAVQQGIEHAPHALLRTLHLADDTRDAAHPALSPVPARRARPVFHTAAPPHVI